MPLILVEDLDGDDQRVVHGEYNDEVVPVLDEFSAALENDLRLLLRLTLLLLFTVASAITVLTTRTCALIF